MAFGMFTLTSCGTDETAKTGYTEKIPVKVTKVNADKKERFISASGKVEAVNSANLSTRMMGYVNTIHVNVGQTVKKGQLLIAISNSDLQARRAQVKAKITEAEAAYNNAGKDYDRFKNLYDQKSVSQKEMDDMTAHFKMAEARLEAAMQMKNEIDAQFAYVNIRAPFNGTITNIFTDEGDMANPGVPLVSVEGPGQFEVTAMVPESEISGIRSGIDVDVFIRSIDKAVKGKITEISTSAKNTGGQYLVKAVLTGTDTSILSGMYATVQFPVKSEPASSVVLLPKNAIVTKGQLTGVYTVSTQGTAILRWLRLGKTYGDMVEVLSGFSADESYIVSARSKLYNGAKVSIE